MGRWITSLAASITEVCLLSSWKHPRFKIVVFGGSGIPGWWGKLCDSMALKQAVKGLPCILMPVLPQASSLSKPVIWAPLVFGSCCSSVHSAVPIDWGSCTLQAASNCDQQADSNLKYIQK